jgi:hypothetical protein
MPRPLTHFWRLPLSGSTSSRPPRPTTLPISPPLEAVAEADEQPPLRVEREPAGAVDAARERDRLDARPVDPQDRAARRPVPALARDEQPALRVDERRLEQPELRVQHLGPWRPRLAVRDGAGRPGGGRQP